MDFIQILKIQIHLSKHIYKKEKKKMKMKNKYLNTQKIDVKMKR